MTSLFGRILLFLIINIVVGNNAQDTITISTQLGMVEGTKHSRTGREDVYRFAGIQYAHSPLEDLRFRPSQLNSSKWNGVYNATKYGYVCMQFPLLTQILRESMDEDCLFLNIYTPKPNNSGTPLPVFIWIHGGGYVVGASSEFAYEANGLVGEGQDFVFVSINYRLGAFGFLQSQELFDEDPNWKSYGGLNGINDQITAMKYVQQYISDYGGDPNQITIFGESAGGLSVCNLLISPLAVGLFQRAIIESGACTGGWGAVNTTYGLSTWESMLTDAGYPNDNITFLRSLSATEFEQKMEFVIEQLWQGSVDGLVLTDTAKNIYTNLDKLNVVIVDKVVIGFNTLDGVGAYPWHLGGSPPRNDEEYKAKIAKFVSNETQQDSLYNTYYAPADFDPLPPNHNSFELAWWSQQADCCLTCPSLMIANHVTRNTGTDLYIYQFGGPGKNGTHYAPHASELPFVFDIPEEDHAFDMPWDKQLSDRMISAWTNFAKFGVPNVTLNGDYIEWKKYDETDQNVIFWRDSVKMVSGFADNYRHNVCEFWFGQVGEDVMSSICNQSWR